jgi:hypothetical protein
MIGLENFTEVFEAIAKSISFSMPDDKGESKNPR